MPEEEQEPVNQEPKFETTPAKTYDFNLADDTEASVVNLGKIIDPEDDQFTTEILTGVIEGFISVT